MRFLEISWDFVRFWDFSKDFFVFFDEVKIFFYEDFQSNLPLDIP